MATLKVTTLLVVVMLLPLLTNSIQVNVDYSDPRYDKMLNTCIDSKNHKVKPGPEDKLHNQVAGNITYFLEILITKKYSY